MANFFKDYQNAIKQKRLEEIKQEQEEKQKQTAINNYIDKLKKGQKFKYNFNGKTENGYFISDCNGFIWFSDTKQDALCGYGWTLSKNYIIV